MVISITGLRLIVSGSEVVKVFMRDVVQLFSAHKNMPFQSLSSLIFYDLKEVARCIATLCSELVDCVQRISR